MQFDLLCSGSKGNSCLIRHQGHAFLIDCGQPSREYLEKALEQVGCSIKEIETVLITHCHRDHTKRLPTFRRLPVHAGCRLSFRDKEKKRIIFNKIPVHPNCSFELFGIKVTPIQLSHDAGPTVGYLLEDGQESLVYVTDTGYFRNSYHGLLRNATWYIFESNYDEEMLRNCKRPRVVKKRIRSDKGHLSNEESARHLVSMAGEDTRQIVLAHISQETNTPEKALESLQKAILESRKPLGHIALMASSQTGIVSSLHDSKED